MLTIHVWPKRLKEFLLTHPLYKSPTKIPTATSMQILLSMFNLHTVSTALTPRHGRGRPRGCLRTLQVRLRRICPSKQSFFGAWAARL